MRANTPGEAVTRAVSQAARGWAMGGLAHLGSGGQRKTQRHTRGQGEEAEGVSCHLTKVTLGILVKPGWAGCSGWVDQGSAPAREGARLDWDVDWQRPPVPRATVPPAPALSLTVGFEDARVGLVAELQFRGQRKTGRQTEQPACLVLRPRWRPLQKVAQSRSRQAREQQGP